MSLKRWIPSWVRCQHLARYEWVAARVQGLEVIDAACGTGYGARMLLDAGARSVKAFDLSAEAIEESRRDFSADKLAFAIGDVTRLPLPDQCCDAYVSFETIEHVVDHETFLRESRRVLRPGGTFFCSTPNRCLVSPGSGKPLNAFHVREYSAEEFTQLLGLFYGRVELYGQSLYSAPYLTLLGRIGRFSPLLAVRLHQVQKACASSLDTVRRHWPRAVDGKRHAEMLVALCET